MKIGITETPYSGGALSLELAAAGKIVRRKALPLQNHGDEQRSRHGS